MGGDKFSAEWDGFIFFYSGYDRGTSYDWLNDSFECFP